MTTKEQIKRIASHPKRGRELANKMLYANRSGADVVITVGGKTIKLKRVI